MRGGPQAAPHPGPLPTVVGRGGVDSMSIQITFPDGNIKLFDAPITGLAIAQGLVHAAGKRRA